MAIRNNASIAVKRKDVAKLRGTNKSSRAETDENSRMVALEHTVIRLLKRIAKLENKIKVMVKVTRDSKGRETIIVKE